MAKSMALAKPKRRERQSVGETGRVSEGGGRWRRTAGNFMRIMTIIVIKSKMLSNCLINLLCKLWECVCGRGWRQGQLRHAGRQFRVAAVGRRHFTISIKTSTI